MDRLTPEDLFESYTWVWYQIKNAAAKMLSDTGARQAARRTMWVTMHTVFLGQVPARGIFAAAFEELAFQISVIGRREGLQFGPRDVLEVPIAEERILGDLALACGESYRAAAAAGLSRGDIDLVCAHALMYDPGKLRSVTIPAMVSGIDQSVEPLRRLYWEIISHSTPHNLFCAVGQEIARDEHERMLMVNSETYAGGVDFQWPERES